MTAYYNENHPPAAAWLRELISRGHLPAGEVDERSIEDVTPADLTGFRECHFFAGIGGWPLALRYAGWDGPVWTGSCPCQPFSTAGARAGTDDPRHLWPIWRWLIDQCRPQSVFGEQVASRVGREWFAGVRADLDLLGYTTGAADLCAAGVGAPHIRQRVFWVGHARSTGTGRDARTVSSPETESDQERLETWGIADGTVDAGAGRGKGFWGESVWINCEEGKARRIELGVTALAPRLPETMELVRGYGNSIVPQVAAAFVRASMGGSEG